MDETTWRRVVGCYLVAWIIVLVGVLMGCWPAHPSIPKPNATDANAVQGGQSGEPAVTIAAPDANGVEAGRIYLVRETSDEQLVMEPIPHGVSDVDLLILVLTTGALGACLHGISSLALWVGKNKFSKDWVLWYLYRPFSGALLALMFYLIVRGGFMPQVGASSAGFYGIIGLSGLIGLFSRQALNKLSELFNVIFAPQEPETDRLKDQPTERDANPVPAIEPFDAGEIIPAGQASASLTVRGKDFVRGCVVRVKNVGVDTQFVSDKELKAMLRKEDIAEPGVLEIAVFNPPPEGGLSNVATVTVGGGTE